MKTMNRVWTFARTGIAVLAVALLAACQNTFFDGTKKDAAAAGTTGPAGQVTVSIAAGDDAPRTIMPEVTGFAVSLSQDGTNVQTKEFAGTSGTLDSVSEGTYLVSVLAYAAAPEAAAGKVVVASGTADLTVAVNQAASVTVPLSWKAFSSTHDASGTNGSTLATGGVSITLKAPIENFDTTGITLRDKNYTDIAAGFEEPDESGLKVYKLNASNLAPGMYLMEAFSRKTDTRQANWYDTVWVFAGVKTTAERTFTDADYFGLPAALQNPRVLRVNNQFYLDGEYGDQISGGIRIYNSDKSSYTDGSLRTIKDIAGSFLESYSGDLSVSATNGYGSGPVSAALPWPGVGFDKDNFQGGDAEILVFTDVTSTSSSAVFWTDVFDVYDLEFQIIQATSRADIDTFSEVWSLAKETSWVNESAVTFDAVYKTGRLPFTFEYDVPVVTLLVRTATSHESIRWFQEPACPVADQDTVPPTVSFTKWYINDSSRGEFSYIASDNIDAPAGLTVKKLVSTERSAIDTVEEAESATESSNLAFDGDLPPGWSKGVPLYAALLVSDSAGNRILAGPLEAVDLLPPVVVNKSIGRWISDAERIGFRFAFGDYWDSYALYEDLSYRVSYAPRSILPGNYTSGPDITGSMKARLDTAEHLIDWTGHAELFNDPGISNVKEAWGMDASVFYKFVEEVRDSAGNTYYKAYLVSSPMSKKNYLDSVLDSKITWSVSGNTRNGVQGIFTLPTGYTDDVGDALTFEWSEVSDESGNISLSGGAATVITSVENKTVTLRATVTWTGGSFTRDYDFTIVSSIKGVISGSLKYDQFDAGGSSAIPSAPIKASVNSDMSSPAGSTVTDANGMYSMTLDAASYFVSFESALANEAIWKEANGSEMTSLGGNVYRTESTVAVAAGTTTTVNFVISGY